jgi:hypothetical protein
MKSVLTIILSCFCITAVHADDESIRIDVKINDKPVRLKLDTAASSSLILYSMAVQRLGLKLITPDPRYPKIDGIVWEMTEPLNFEWGWIKVETSIPVWQTRDPEEDGIIGWPFIRDFFNQYYLQLDLSTTNLNWLTNLPTGLETWSKFQLETNHGILAIQISRQKDKASVLVFDTGTPLGVKLGPEKFQEWGMSHTKPMTTFETYHTANDNFIISELGWAKDISFGSLKITDVPLEAALPGDIASGTSTNTQFVAILGVAALKRLEIIIDNKNNVAYLRPEITPPLPYEHNRLGAVFTPKYPNTNSVAYVADGSPAYEAGIRNGDILLNQEANSSFEQPAGTKINFTLKRDDKIFKTTAILRNILSPDSK